jgi:hypothetical protein
MKAIRFQYCRDNKLFTEFCPKMVAAAVEVAEEIILQESALML